jgi:hypothetical protein
MNDAVRRVGMYGGEIALELYFDALAFVDRREAEWAAERAGLRDRRAATPQGVDGGVEVVLGHRSSDVMSSVYADIAHRLDWLTLDRPLSATEYDRVTESTVDWCRRDSTNSDVLSEFGAPTVLIGSDNPYWPHTLAYGTLDRRSPFVFFHLWNGTAPGEPDTWPPPRAEPVLLCVSRRGDGDFQQDFTFTPYGTSRRA